MLDRMAESGDFVKLKDSDEYAQYFNHLTNVFNKLVKWYKNLIDGGGTEEKIISSFLNRMLFTVDMLRLKHAYNPQHALHLDLNDSGFPHSITVMELEADLRLKPEKLRTLSPRNMLMELMLSEMFDKKTRPQELQKQMAEVEYFTSLDESKLMFAFTPGELELKADRPDYRKYLYSWACYDFSTNMVYTHLLAFDQDKTEEPLEDHGPAFDRFLSIIKAEGSRVPTLGVMASSIDEALVPIHPKVLKRLRIGPIICPKYSLGSNIEPILDPIKKFGDSDDFALRMVSEVIYSERQVVKQRKFLDFNRAKRVKEIFLIPDSVENLRGSSHQATNVYDHIILPHHVLQEVVGDPMFGQYMSMQRIVYTKEGAVYAV